MKQFESYIFKKDDISSSNQEVLRERPQLIAILLILSGLTLIFLDYSTFGVVVTILGLIIYTLSRFSVFTPKIKTGQLTKQLVLTSDFIKLEDRKILFTDTDFVNIELQTFQGQLAGNLSQVWKADGRNNSIEISINNKLFKTYFWLPTFKHVKIIKSLELPDKVKIFDKIKY